MKNSMLQIQQYINIHPILSKDDRIRVKYADLLQYLVDKQGKRDIWTKQLLKLYIDKIGLNENQSGKSSKTDRVKPAKLVRYRYLILIDILFICFYADKEKGECALEDVINFYGARYRKKFTLLFEMFYSDGEERLPRDLKKYESILDVVWNNRNYQGKPLKKIMITANMSAGKSTLLNALAGVKVSKTQNDACTAKIHYLFNKAGDDGLIYEWDHDLELNASNKILMDDNENNDSNEISVGVRFRSVNNIESRICFIDTPGVNSSMDQEHRRITNEAIDQSNSDLLIYLFNAENIGSNDDNRHLKYVREHYHGPVLFLVNKLDDYRRGSDSIEETLCKAAKDLKKIGFDHPEIYPISAYGAYLAKMAIYGNKLTEDEQDDLEFRKRKLKKDCFRYNEYYPNKVSIRENDEMQSLLLHSGILSLEGMIYS